MTCRDAGDLRPVDARRHVLRAAVGLAAGAAAAASLRAQEPWPTRPITLVVPFPPGSTSDLSARLVAQSAAATLGQPVTVENRPGANGQIGMQAVARARPDGYTLVVGSVSSTVVPPVIQRSVPFELKDFTPVSVIANTTLVLLASRDAPFASVAELVAAARRAPGTTSYANSAGLYRIAMEAFNLQAGIDLAPVAYKGPAEAAADLVAGRITVAPDSLGSATRLIQGGRVRALAVLSAQRTPLLPDLPTMAELGYRDFAFAGWIGVLGPTGIPTEVAERLAQAFQRALATDTVRAQYRTLALEPTWMGPQAYGDTLQRELDKYLRIGRDARIEKQ